MFKLLRESCYIKDMDMILLNQFVLESNQVFLFRRAPYTNRWAVIPPPPENIPSRLSAIQIGKDRIF